MEEKTIKPYKNLWEKATKNWKNLKENNANIENDIDSKKPPWRMVSLSTLPKADKNALLRAKLLDASRRLRVVRAASVITQTDFPSVKLFKEANLDIQTDLIEVKDVSILTDGSITLKKEGTGEFILTHSIAQMTEAIMAVDVATQTILPKLPGSAFFDVYFDRKSETKASNDDPAFNFNAREKKLIKQIRKIRNLTSHGNENFSDDSLSDTEIEINETSSKMNITSALLKPNKTHTHSFWHFEYDDDNVPINKRPRPWSSFSTFDFDNRLEKMKLIPLSQRTKIGNIKTIIEPLTYEYYSAIEDLIQKSNKLIDLSNDISTLIQSNIESSRKNNKNNSWKLQLKPFELPSKKWLPIIEKQDKELEEKISNFEKFKMKKQFSLINVAQ